MAPGSAATGRAALRLLLLAAAAVAADDVDRGQCEDVKEPGASSTSLLQLQRLPGPKKLALTQFNMSTLSAWEVEGCSSESTRPGLHLDQEQVPDWQLGTLHSIVGKDGVLMISLQSKPERFLHSASRLRSARIYPVPFPATDLDCATQNQLNLGCWMEVPGSKEQCSARGKEAWGCTKRSEMAVSDSHRRALSIAQARPQEWTAIFEDDVVLTTPPGTDWDTVFREAWKQVPDQAKLVRLSRCVVKEEGKNSPAEAGMKASTYYANSSFGITQWTGYWTTYLAGGCTAAYLVHKDFIPELLTAFPCCCALDCCFEWDVFNRMNFATGAPRGMEVMFNIDLPYSLETVWQRTPNNIMQFGILGQERELLSSTQRQ